MEKEKYTIERKDFFLGECNSLDEVKQKIKEDCEKRKAKVSEYGYNVKKYEIKKLPNNSSKIVIDYCKYNGAGDHLMDGHHEISMWKEDISLLNKLEKDLI